MSNTPETRIADKLRPIVDEARLVRNAFNYEVMRAELSSQDERRINDIAQRLLGLPLTHGLRNNDALESIRKEGLLSDARRGGQGDNTFTIDRSVGLDEYVFMRWGQIDDVFYGDHVVIDGSVLLENTVVTPYDITLTAGAAGQDLKPHEYPELDDRAKDALDAHYFDHMVSGKDWLEITARTIYQFARRKPHFPYPLDGLSYPGLGEVKRWGSVPPHLITGHLALSGTFTERKAALKEWNEAILRYGIALDTPESTLELREHLLRNRPEALARFKQGGWLNEMGIVVT